MRKESLIFLCVSIVGLSIPKILYAQTYGDLDTGFRFSLSRSETDPIGVIAKLTTTSDYPCEGYRLKTKVSHQRDTVTISILGMVQPTPCYAAYAKATGGAFLGNKVAGKYLLRFLYRGVSDVYRLTFADGRSILTPIIVSFTEEQHTEELNEKE